MNDLSTHLMEDLRPGFYREIEKGDFIVAGQNFGMGTSREQAPLVIKAAGCSAVIAKSFARIFYRNCINVGLPLIECDTSGIEEGDVLRVDLEGGIVHNLTKGKEIKTTPLPKVMLKILEKEASPSTSRSMAGSISIENLSIQEQNGRVIGHDRTPFFSIYFLTI